MKKITSIKQLKDLIAKQENGLECFIALNGGIRSSKQIWFNGKKFEVYNFVDDTEQKLTEAELFTKSNIGEAIKKHALIMEE